MAATGMPMGRGAYRWLAGFLSAAPAVLYHSGDAIYRQRCAVCHHHPQESIPPRVWIARKSRAEIVDAPPRGAMRAQGSGLSPEDIEAIARALR